MDYEANPKTELVASLFKVFLRELPEPLLTHSLYPRFLAAAGALRCTLQLIGMLTKPQSLDRYKRRTEENSHAVRAYGAAAKVLSRTDRAHHQVPFEV